MSARACRKFLLHSVYPESEEDSFCIIKLVHTGKSFQFSYSHLKLNRLFQSSSTKPSIAIFHHHNHDSSHPKISLWDIWFSIIPEFHWLCAFVSVMARRTFPFPDAHMSLCATKSLPPISSDELIKIPSLLSRKSSVLLERSLYRRL